MSQDSNISASSIHYLSFSLYLFLFLVHNNLSLISYVTGSFLLACQMPRQHRLTPHSFLGYICVAGSNRGDFETDRLGFSSNALILDVSISPSASSSSVITFICRRRNVPLSRYGVELSQGCLSASSEVSRFSGSTTISFDRKSTISGKVGLS